MMSSFGVGEHRAEMLMTVAELIAKLQDVPNQNVPVVFEKDGEWYSNDEGSYLEGAVNASIVDVTNLETRVVLTGQ